MLVAQNRRENLHLKSKAHPGGHRADSRRLRTSDADPWTSSAEPSLPAAAAIKSWDWRPTPSAGTAGAVAVAALVAACANPTTWCRPSSAAVAAHGCRRMQQPAQSRPAASSLLFSSSTAFALRSSTPSTANTSALSSPRPRGRLASSTNGGMGPRWGRSDGGCACGLVHGIGFRLFSRPLDGLW